MQLRIDDESLDALYNTVSEFYEFYGNRHAVIFESIFSTKSADSYLYVRFLLDRKYVIEYKVSQERGVLLASVLLAIGPHYFSAADFWDYQNSQRFTLEASTQSVFENLRVLDDFLGYSESHTLSKWPTV